MAWQQLILELPAKQRESVEQCAVGLGALAVTLEDAGNEPLFEPAPGETPVWTRLRLIALFPADVDRLAVARAFTGLGVTHSSWAALDDRVWERVWLDDFKPVCFGDRLWICPHGQTPKNAENVVHMDPGLAFGTGRHATTALCLEWLAGADVKGRVVLDYGCGSGILGLAAAVLGARRVYAIDIDPQALIATRDNARSNALEETFVIGDPTTRIAPAADIVIANILAGPLISLAATLADGVRSGGHVVLSGILEEQVDRVCLAYAPWFDMQSSIIHAGWARVNGMRNDRVHTVS